MLIAALLSSLQPIFARYAYDDGANIWGIVLMRFLLPGIILVMCFKRPASLRLRPTLILGGVYGLISVFYFSSLQYISAGLAAILLYIYPLFIFVVALLFREETLSFKRATLLAIALLGVYFSIEAGSGNSTLGIILALGSAIACGSYIMGCRRVLPADGGIAAAGWVMVGATLLFMIPLAMGEVVLPNTLKGYGAGLALSTLCGVIPISLLIFGVQLVQNDTDVGILSTVEPVSTMLLAWVILTEPLHSSNILGAFMIISALILLMVSSYKKPAAQPTISQ